jgi:serine/threonine protein phosphatase PrpC
MTSDAAGPQGRALPAAPGRLPPGPLSSLVQVDVAGLSHPGKVRPNNEDHFLVVRFGRFLEPLGTNLPAGQAPSRFEDVGYVMAVADGMGGHAAGEEASKLAITTLVNLVLNTPDWFLRMDDPSSAEEVMRRATERFGHIDQALAGEAVEDPRLHRFGTTMTLAASLGRDLLLAHIGDSRAYLFREGTLYQLTRDHTWVGELYQAGTITQAEAATHHLRHFLTRHLGANKGAKPDVQRFALVNGDCLLLCSDGLSEMVGNAEIREILADSGAPEAMSQRLVDRALAAGGKDNVTVIVAQYRAPAAR